LPNYLRNAYMSTCRQLRHVEEFLPTKSGATTSGFLSGMRTCLHVENNMHVDSSREKKTSTIPTHASRISVNLGHPTSRFEAMILDYELSLIPCETTIPIPKIQPPLSCRQRKNRLVGTWFIKNQSLRYAQDFSRSKTNQPGWYLRSVIILVLILTTNEDASMQPNSYPTNARDTATNSGMLIQKKEFYWKSGTCIFCFSFSFNSATISFSIWIGGTLCP